MGYDPVSVAPVGATLGEGPVWIARDQALWFVDIKGRRIHRFDQEGGHLRSWDAPAQPGWVLPAEGGDLLIGLQGGIHRFDPGTGRFTMIAQVEADRPGNRLNDACTDPEGRIWLGSMDDGERAETGRFYRFEDGRVTDAGLPPVSITNGPAVSPDGRLFYHVDTLGRTIHVCDLSQDGTLGPSRLFARIEDGAGYPDGPTVDGEGHVWIGLFAGWAARRYAPDGRLVETARFPTANITKLAFGGADLRTVYATTAAKDLDAAARDAQPDAGNLFSFRADVPGVPVTPAKVP
ncbi:SMP-30/gluconolactonase/LRE family protein [Sphingosinicella sp. LHD-64]|uniref:SMP-30/gluconolactonase/LRE family protein n=1 Tax=Sphingosinicella sp. LHD-64 TaxID=3072139 RepID=UPI002810173D|nr:SMP-30/gluconolactonase/LRE family protein [Sphingosinicella sp. LHD-64]MDQ8757145.1 SMP-30/gluconolactonase/LRE family protein [Sphingosinicella sp. LHD-64]